VSDYSLTPLDVAWVNSADARPREHAEGATHYTWSDVEPPPLNCRCVIAPIKLGPRNPAIHALRWWWTMLMGRSNRTFKRTRLGAIRAEWRAWAGLV